MKKFLHLIFILAFCVVFCAGLCACNKEAYSKPIDASIRITYYGDAEYIKLAAPEEYFEWYENSYDRDFEDYCDDWNDKQWVNMFGQDYEVTYEISNEEKVDKEIFENIKKSLEDEFNIKSSDIKKAYRFDIEYFVKGEKGEDSSKWEEMYAVKIRHDWYIVKFTGKFINFCYDAW